VKHENEIDVLIAKIKQEVYNQAGTFGRKALLYAREVVASATIRGQAYLIEESNKPPAPSQQQRQSRDSSPEQL
jgi:hypothetical protein